MPVCPDMYVFSVLKKIISSLCGCVLQYEPLCVRSITALNKFVNPFYMFDVVFAVREPMRN